VRAASQALGNLSLSSIMLLDPLQMVGEAFVIDARTRITLGLR
jgi:hypothetical protein